MWSLSGNWILIVFVRSKFYCKNPSVIYLEVFLIISRVIAFFWVVALLITKPTIPVIAWCFQPTTELTEGRTRFTNENIWALWACSRETFAEDIAAYQLRFANIPVTLKDSTYLIAVAVNIWECRNPSSCLNLEKCHVSNDNLTPV